MSTYHRKRKIPARILLSAFLFLQVICPQISQAESKAVGKLQVYFIDVEGGQSTLFVTPSGESLLVDTGWPNAKQSDRILAAANLAGIKRLDYVLITHYHIDHAGGVPELLKRIPVGTFIDHGVNREDSDKATHMASAAYQQALQDTHAAHILATPGLKLPMHSMKVELLSADGQTITTPLPGAGEKNYACSATQTRPADQTENARSAGVLITFGKARILDLGDLTWDKEQALMCPNNLIGKIDLYIVSHHGWDQSGSPAFVDGIAPRVAIMDNGAVKGATPSSWEIVERSPRLEDLWQLHRADHNDAEHNVPEERIANLIAGDADQGYYLMVTVSPDKSITVFNSRTQLQKTYKPR